MLASKIRYITWVLLWGTNGAGAAENHHLCALSSKNFGLALNPSSALGWHWSGVLRLFAGQPDLALKHLETGLRLSPRDTRLANYLNAFGEAHFFSRRFDEAAANLLASLERAPSFPVTYRVLAACYAHVGRFDEAREIVRRLVADDTQAAQKARPTPEPKVRGLSPGGGGFELLVPRQIGNGSRL